MSVQISIRKDRFPSTVTGSQSRADAGASPPTAAAAPALGFALFGANASLSDAIQQLPVGGDLVFPIVQQWLWIGLHLGTAYLLAKGWLTDRLGVYLMSAGLLHAAAVYTATLETLGWHPVVVTVILAAVALSAFSGGAGAIPARR